MRIREVRKSRTNQKGRLPPLMVHLARHPSKQATGTLCSGILTSSPKLLLLWILRTSHTMRSHSKLPPRTGREIAQSVPLAQLARSATAQDDRVGNNANQSMYLRYLLHPYPRSRCSLTNYVDVLGPPTCLQLPRGLAVELEIPPETRRPPHSHH